MNMKTYDLTKYYITGGGGSGTSDYSELENKPQINGITLQGNLDADDLGLVDISTFDDNNEVVSAAINSLLRDKADKTEIPDVSAFTTKTYVDSSIETVRGEIPSVPTNVSAFTNDAGYLTQHQDISGKADKTYVDETFIDNETFDDNNEVVSAAINGLIRDKATAASTGAGLWIGTQAEYDALSSYDLSTLYAIK